MYIYELQRGTLVSQEIMQNLLGHPSSRSALRFVLVVEYFYKLFTLNMVELPSFCKWCRFGPPLCDDCNRKIEGVRGP